jgi:NADH-quinone oxidoreductase subunit N
MDDVARSIALLWPEVVLTVGLLLVVLADSFLVRRRDAICRALAVATLVAAMALLVAGPQSVGEAFSGMLAIDPFGRFFRGLLVLASLLVLLVFRARREMAGLGMGEFQTLVLALTLSNMLLAASNDLVMLYLSLEMVSLSSYVLVAYLKGDRMSNEASLKYVLFGAVSTGAMLYGFSLLYGLAGTTTLPGLRAWFEAGLPDAARFSVYVIVFLIVAGFAFKTASVPFHFWCPDVYEGAPTPVAALLSVAPKAAAFAVMVRFFYLGFAAPRTGPWDLAGAVDWQQVLMLVSVLTMTIGNIAALTQTNMKRLLAYSSIAHAGFIMMGVVALSPNGAQALMVYLLAYVFMNLGAFLVVTLVHNQDGTFDLRDYPGLYRRAPMLTLAMSIFLLSLMGIPPLVGFMGKLYVFAAIVEKGPSFWWYAAVGAVNAAVAAYYYARVLKTMIIDEGNEDRPAFAVPAVDGVWVAVLTLANVLPLLFWSRVEELTRLSLDLYARR